MVAGRYRHRTGLWEGHSQALFRRCHLVVKTTDILHILYFLGRSCRSLDQEVQEAQRAVRGVGVLVPGEGLAYELNIFTDR